MRNFPPHLSYVAALPSNTLATEQAPCSRVGVRLWVGEWLWKDQGWRDQLTSDEFQYSFKCVCGTPSWLNIISTTSHVFAVHGPPLMDAYHMKLVSKLFLQPLMTMLVPTPNWKFFHQLSCSLSFKQIKILIKIRSSSPASVAQLAETHWAPTRTVCRRSRGSIPGSAGRFRVRISGVHALRLISRAGKEGSTVSSIICDRWLILT